MVDHMRDSVPSSINISESQKFLFRRQMSITVSIRDFAYPIESLAHLGIFEPSLDSGPRESGDDETDDDNESYMNFSFQRRLSDPPIHRDRHPAQWVANPSSEHDVSSGTLPQTTYRDGPPWSEDEDLHSPVVSTSKHRKHRSSGDVLGRAAVTDPSKYNGRERYETSDKRGSSHPSQWSSNSASRLEPHGIHAFARSDLMDPSLTRFDHGDDVDEWNVEDESDHHYRDDPSRYSRDYQFTIASEDEEMHGKAVALFDFVRENENELPLVEGQVIWVSYRHGQGWLVAEDPKTGENGLVPEEYVRLLRDLHGKWDEEGEEAVESSPSDDNGALVNNSSAHHPAAVSTFSTSSKDLDPYPQHLLGRLASPLSSEDKGKQAARE